MKSFYACDNANHKGQTNTWFTPNWLFEYLGYFDLDPCSESFRPFDTAGCHFCHDLGFNGLALEWSGYQRVWLNPPYGNDTMQWLDKLYKHGNGVALVFSRTETKWAQKHMKLASAINFISGRLSFIHQSKKSTNAANGSMLLAYGNFNIESIAKIKGTIFIPNKSFQMDVQATPSHH